MSNTTGWIGFDLDGTLAHYEGWTDILHIGDPIEKMVNEVKGFLMSGHRVKIFTARVSVENEDEIKHITEIIQDWCEKHIGERLEVTNKKDFGMLKLYDDRCVQVETNTGRIIE